MSEYTVDHVHLLGFTRFKVLGAVTPIELPADGVLEIQSGSMAIIKDGETLRGIRLVDSSGDLVSEDDTDEDANMLMLAAEDGGTVSVIHEDNTVSEEEERMFISDGVDSSLLAMTVQVFGMYCKGASGRRWKFADWAGA